MALSSRCNFFLTYGCLLAILLGGFCLRVYRFDTCPRGLNQDEASIGYDAFSVVQYGVTRNGSTYPMHFVGWGSGQGGLYHYLIMPFIKIFGLSESTVRIGNLLAQTASILVFFFLMKAMSKPLVGLMGSFLIAITPWSIIGSRWGFEAYLLPVVILVGTFIYVKAFKNWRYLPWSFVVLGLSLYDYSTAYFFVPLFLLYLLWDSRRIFPDFASYLRGTGISLCAFTLTSIPVAIFILINMVWKTMGAISLFGITIPKLHQTGARYQKFLLLDSHAHTVQQFMQALGQYWHYFYETIVLQLGPIWCVLESHNHGYYYHFSTIFLAVGLVATVAQWIAAIRKKKDFPEAIFIAWFAIAALLGILCETNTFRIGAIFFALYYFIAKGIYETGRAAFYQVSILFRNNRVATGAQWAIYGIAAIIYIWHLCLFYPEYLSRFSGAYGPWLRESLGNAFAYVDSIKTADENIYVTDHDPNTLYVYVLFYEKVDPRYFQQNAIYADLKSEWRPVSEFGRYKIVYEKSALRDPVPGGLYVARRNDADLIPLRPESIRKDFKHYSVIRF
jgi:hypothetical protein